MNSTLHSFPASEMDFPKVYSFRADQVIFGQGQVFSGYFLIKSGLVKITRLQENGQRTLFSIKTQGEIIGEPVDLDGKQIHGCMAYSLGNDTKIEEMAQKHFLTQVGEIRLMKLLEVLQTELQEARLRLERVLFLDAEARIKAVLKELAGRLGRKFGMETLLKIPLTHENLAEMSDTSRQTVSMVMSGLKAQNKINYSRGRILFRDLANF